MKTELLSVSRSEKFMRKTFWGEGLHCLYVGVNEEIIREYDETSGKIEHTRISNGIARTEHRI